MSDQAPAPVKRGRGRPPTVDRKRDAKTLARIVELRYDKGLSYGEIAQLIGAPEQTIRDWIKPFRSILDNPDEVRTFKQNEAEFLDGIRWLLHNGMVTQLTDPERVRKLDFSRLSWAYATLYDKSRLERGESTVNANLSLSDLVRRAHAIDVTPAAPAAEAPTEAVIVEEKKSE